VLAGLDAQLAVNTIFLVDGRPERHGLGKPDADTFAGLEVQIPAAGNNYWTDFGAGPATHTFGHIHISRFQGQIYYKVPSLSGNPVDANIGQQFNIGMTGHFHQFGAQNADRAVQSGKGLV